MAASIFISHSSKDQKVAASICNALENRGLQCWISSRNVPPGENFQEAIVRAIRESRIMLLVFSANSNNSEEIKKELVLASQTKLVVIPLRVEDVKPNDAFSYELATRQWINMFDDWERSLEEVVAHISRAVASAASTPAESIAEPASPLRTATVAKARPRRWLVPASALGVVAVLGMAVLVWTQMRTQPAPITASPHVSAREALDKGTDAERRKQFAEALDWYRKAADQGDSEGRVRVGNMYRIGMGVQQDYAEALRYYRLAADQGNPNGQNALAFMYQQGLGVTQDYAEAARLLQLSANQGNSTGQYDLGSLYEKGLGVKVDNEEAARLFKLSADQGNPHAQNSLGVMFARGVGVKQDYTEAARLFRLSADQGLPGGQFDLGRLYELGQGVPQDRDQAVAWYRKAAAQSDPNAKAALQRLGPQSQSAQPTLAPQSSTASPSTTPAQTAMPPQEGKATPPIDIPQLPPSPSIPTTTLPPAAPAEPPSGGGEVARLSPPTPAAPPSASEPRPRPVPDLQGRVTNVASGSIIKVDSRTVVLYGIIDDASQQKQQEHKVVIISYLVPPDLLVDCYRKGGNDRYQCYSGGKDLAALALRDGIAHLAPDAPEEYRALVRARAATRP
jgi:TPR repeat protein